MDDFNLYDVLFTAGSAVAGLAAGTWLAKLLLPAKILTESDALLRSNLAALTGERGAANKLAWNEQILALDQQKPLRRYVGDFSPLSILFVHFKMYLLIPVMLGALLLIFLAFAEQAFNYDEQRKSYSPEIMYYCMVAILFANLALLFHGFMLWFSTGALSRWLKGSKSGEIDALVRRVRAVRLAALLKQQRPELSALRLSETGPDAIAGIYRDLVRVCYVFDVEELRFVRFKLGLEEIAFGGDSPDAVSAEIRAQADARVAENEDWIFAGGITKFFGWVGLPDEKYFIEDGALHCNFWPPGARKAKVFAADKLIIAGGAPGLDYDHAVAAVLDRLYDAEIRLPVELRDAPPLSENTRRMLDAYAQDFR